MPVRLVALEDGSLFTSDAQTLVCTVNTVGVMGAGVALVFKKMFPDMFTSYKRACRDQYFVRHNNWLYHVKDGRKVLCMRTKYHWRYPSKPEWVEAALKELAQHYEEWCIESIAMPPPGCGNGGLLWWEEVHPLVMKYLDPLPIPVTVYLPQNWLVI